MTRLMDPRRNYADECGYKKPSEITVEEFQDMYDEEPIASRVVHVLTEDRKKLAAINTGVLVMGISVIAMGYFLY